MKKLSSLRRRLFKTPRKVFISAEIISEKDVVSFEGAMDFFTKAYGYNEALKIYTEFIVDRRYLPREKRWEFNRCDYILLGKPYLIFVYRTQGGAIYLRFHNLHYWDEFEIIGERVCPLCKQELYEIFRIYEIYTTIHFLKCGRCERIYEQHELLEDVRKEPKAPIEKMKVEEAKDPSLDCFKGAWPDCDMVRERKADGSRSDVYIPKGKREGEGK